jgi:hypothetical protein
MYVRNLGEERPVRETPCIYLRNKILYVTGQLRNPDHPDEADHQHCWCNLTQHVIGPDQRQVGLRNCINGRDCFRETY